MTKKYKVGIIRTIHRRQFLVGKIVQQLAVLEDEVEAIIRDNPTWKVERDRGAIIMDTGAPYESTLCFASSALYIINPSPMGMELLLKLAERLGGRVMGDGFESYRTPHETYIHPDDAEQANQKMFVNNRRSRFKAMPWMKPVPGQP
ncbi:hypothetical protein [Sandaracinobacteroides saxicola]|uniref:Uncharacterized protein n=1 Tax=Sandaracinobacteroides saxicola TaxID=2759707 RepID=A0A7G5IIC4_9SPHN|nr:hypothetical protein [Sandaracinobacteroides saxicola]QMW23116.1 hypothetical protein H3309_00940 [Sandaracinobacteroides saxicola]